MRQFPDNYARHSRALVQSKGCASVAQDNGMLIGPAPRPYTSLRLVEIEPNAPGPGLRAIRAVAGIARTARRWWWCPAAAFRIVGIWPGRAFGKGAWPLANLVRIEGYTEIAAWNEMTWRCDWGFGRNPNCSAATLGRTTGRGPWREYS